MTDTDDYHKQRLEGARLIDEEIRMISKKYNVEDIEVEWDRGEKIVDRNFHILKVSCRGVTVETRLSDENLADFPGVVGTETTKGIIKKLILDLKNKSK
jgi:hypothetical protein